MEYIRISEIDFKENIENRVFGIFLAQDVEVRTQKDGVTKFLALNMVDKSIKVQANKFGATDEEIEMMKSGGVYTAAIDIKAYSKSATGYSCILYNFDVLDEDPATFIEWAEGREYAVSVIQGAMKVIYGSIYKDLVANILTENKENWSKFVVWGAATGMHHNLLGGLLVHTGEVLEQCEVLADYWNARYSKIDSKTSETKSFINKPLLFTGALLHDIGKLYELDSDSLTGVIKYTDRATLEPHSSIGISMIEKEAYRLGMGLKTESKSDSQVELEQQALSLLKHLILSHHGKKEFGASIEPSCPEAIILNRADDMSAIMYRYNKNFNTMEAGTSQSAWLGGGLVNTFKDYTK
jgi:3'-5' exoribonuclease